MRDPRLYSYLDERCGPIPAYLETVERNTYLKTLAPQMLSGKMQGRFMAWLTGWLRQAHVQKLGAENRPFRVLEIGTFTGYSALCFAERLLPGDEVHTIEIDVEREQLIRNHIELAGFSESITLHMGDANEVIKALAGPWDLVYLDAKKEDYPTQFETVAKQLNKGGYILLDNVLWNGEVLDPTRRRATTQLLREFTLSLALDERWESLLLPMSDGLMLVGKR